MKFKKKILKSGLTVLHEKRDVPVTTVMLAVKHGGAYESKEEKGMSHFMEHLCFKGTKKRNAKEIAESIEKVGGILNAFTDEELTSYYSKLPCQHLETAMDVIFDIFFNPSFPEEEVKKEAHVIVEEMKMVKDNPSRYIYDKIKGCLYENPLGLDLIGNKDRILSMSREELYKKHRKIYFPKNSILAVVGNNDFEEVVSLAEKFVIEREGEQDFVQKIETKNEDGYLKKKGNHQSNMALGIHFPKGSDKERYAAELFCAILGRGMSSRLFTEVREKRGLVYVVRSDLDMKKDFGYMVIYAGCDPSKTEEVIKVCKDEYFKMDNVTEKELEEAKIQLIGNKDISSESSENVAIDLVLEEIISDAKEHYNYENNIMAVTLDEIKKLAKKSNFSSFIIGP